MRPSSPTLVRSASSRASGATPVTTDFIHEGWRVLEERQATGSGGVPAEPTAANLTAQYVYGRFIDEPVLMRRDHNLDGDFLDTNEVLYYLHDDMFNVVALADASGNVVERYDYLDYGSPQFFDSAGAQQAIAISAYYNPYLFNSRRYDPELGFYHYRTRYMDPATGRFITRDVIGIWGDISNLGNGYTYCANNPWTMIDPYGLNSDHWGNGGFYLDWAGGWFVDAYHVVSTPTDALFNWAYGNDVHQQVVNQSLNGQITSYEKYPGELEVERAAMRVSYISSGVAIAGAIALDAAATKAAADAVAAAATAAEECLEDDTCIPTDAPGEAPPKPTQYPRNPDDWKPPEDWQERRTGEETGGRHRHWEDEDGNLRREYDREGRDAGRRGGPRGPHWHDYDDETGGERHIEPGDDIIDWKIEIIEEIIGEDNIGK